MRVVINDDDEVLHASSNSRTFEVTGVKSVWDLATM